MNQKKQTYKNQNVMEFLVDQEIEYQLDNRKTPPGLSAYISVLEVATYALNRLPALYASSTEGIERQKRIGKEKYKRKIEQAVSLGFAAVERDPLRKSNPITIETEKIDTIEDAKQTLSQLGDSIPQEELSWIVSFMEAFLQRVKNKQITEKEVVKLYYLLYYFWQENK